MKRWLQNNYKMVEVMEGSVIHTSRHIVLPSNVGDWVQCMSMPQLTFFFKKETLAASCAKGNETIQTLVGTCKVCFRFSKECPTPNQVIQKIDVKCVEARRPQRIRVLKPQQNN